MSSESRTSATLHLSSAVYMGSGYASLSSGTTKQSAQLLSSCLTLEAFQINITKSLPNAITCFLDDTAYIRFSNST